MVQDLRSTNAPTPDTILGRTVIERILVPPSVGSCRSPHLDLPLHHAVHNLRPCQQTDSFYPTDATHLLGRRIPPHSIEGFIEGPSIVMHPAFFTFLFTFFLLLQRLIQDIPREKTRQPLLLEARKEIQRLQSDYRTTRRYSHPNPTRRYRQNPWAPRPSSPTPPYDSLEGSDPSSPERRDDDEPRLANTLGRQREPGRWDGTLSPMAQQRA